MHIGYADLCRDPLDTETEGMVNHCEQVGRVAVSALVNQIFRNETGKGEIFTKTLVEGEWSGS